MNTTKQTKPCFTAATPMWRRAAAVSVVIALATIVRADVAASHSKGRFPTSEVD